VPRESFESGSAGALPGGWSSLASPPSGGRARATEPGPERRCGPWSGGGPSSGAFQAVCYGTSMVRPRPIRRLGAQQVSIDPAWSCDALARWPDVHLVSRPLFGLQDDVCLGQHSLCDLRGYILLKGKKASKTSPTIGTTMTGGGSGTRRVLCARPRSALGCVIRFAVG
jgi:hypothetical protein